MTVKELIAKLNEFDGDMIVRVYGGEDYRGEWGELAIGKMYERPYTWQGKTKIAVEFDYNNATVIMDDETI